MSSVQLFAPGHTACAGCGMPIAIKLILEVAGKIPSLYRLPDV